MEPQPPPMTFNPASHSPQQHPHHYYIPSQRRYSQQDEHDHYSNPAHSQLAGRGHDSVLSHQFSPKGSSPPSPRSSVSSAGRHRRAATSEIEPIETQPRSPRNVPYPAQAHVVDPEKAVTASPRHCPTRAPNTHVSSSNADVTAVLYESADYNEKGPEEKAVQLLLYLSGPCAFLSLVITLWTLFSLFIALLLQPFRICTARQNLSTQLKTFLAPPLNLHLHLIYSYSSATDYSIPLLIIIHLLSPLVASGVAVMAWTSAFFWCFSALLGDPAGQDGHNDGKDSILGVRNWWDRWLSRALR
ncbi:hypothetical protein GQ43DRAFT_17108 [Delitschia confertaspora ATCC 74209]|uniref:Uncharacterized protein n=1 Tax=Delitschia confertaspora ATCC 74209 TaxID=1513339 RepID=A0A9P4JRJ8_9PLEO|nr:hypothetical protein GQ43DRAFT_17108 [Delitschia confertaspora ATCC 74209]